MRVKLVILPVASVCLVIYMVKIINVVDAAVSLDRITDKIRTHLTQKPQYVVLRNYRSLPDQLTCLDTSGSYGSGLGR